MIRFFICWHKNFGYIYQTLIGWFIKLSVQFQPIFFINIVETCKSLSSIGLSLKIPDYIESWSAPNGFPILALVS